MPTFHSSTSNDCDDYYWHSAMEPDEILRIPVLSCHKQSLVRDNELSYWMVPRVHLHAYRLHLPI